MLWKHMWKAAVGAFVAVNATAPVFAQDSRSEVIASERAAKAAQLRPYVPGRLEKLLLWYEDTDPLTKIAPHNGFFVEWGYPWKPVGSGIAASVGWRHDALDRNARILLATGASTRGYWMARSDFSFPRLLDERLEIGVGGGYRFNPQEDFYGLGFATSEGDRVSYRYSAPEVEARAVLSPFDWLHAGTRFGRLDVTIASGTDSRFPSIEQSFDDATAPGLAAQPAYRYNDVFVTLDTRDQPGNARDGAFVNVNWRRYHDLDLDRYDFDRVNVDVQHFLPIFDKKRVFAARVQLITTAASDLDDVPFYMRPTIGGSDTLRSYAEFRFRERNAAIANLEYRWEAFSGLDMALLADFATVAPTVEGLQFRELRGAYGIGLRFNTYKSVFLRLDVAGGGSDGIHTFLKFSKAF